MSNNVIGVVLRSVFPDGVGVGDYGKVLTLVSELSGVLDKAGEEHTAPLPSAVVVDLGPKPRQPTLKKGAHGKRQLLVKMLSNGQHHSIMDLAGALNSSRASTYQMLRRARARVVTPGVYALGRKPKP